MLEDTLIILSADHGEELGGHGGMSPTDAPCTSWCTSRLSCGCPDRIFRPREDRPTGSVDRLHAHHPRLSAVSAH